MILVAFLVSDTSSNTLRFVRRDGQAGVYEFKLISIADYEAAIAADPSAYISGPFSLTTVDGVTSLTIPGYKSVTCTKSDDTTYSALVASDSTNACPGQQDLVLGSVVTDVIDPT